MIKLRASKIILITCGKVDNNHILERSRYLGYREPKYVGKFGKKDNAKVRPNRSVFKSKVFWDIDFDDIDWMEDRHVVIHRVYESGTEKEIAEILKVARKEVPQNLIMKEGKWKYVEHK